jgi:neopullulanase
MRLAAAILLAVSGLFAAQPEVLKVEPPNWWPGHTINPVRLLIRGRNLSGARIENAGVGLHASNFKVSENGTYLFADLSIDPAAAPGKRELRVVTTDGSAVAPFEVSAPLPREGRFQGFSSDDVIYLVVPDRFADGDPANDDPPQSPGLLDRSKGRYYHGGDLQGIINHLPYIKSLGATAVWVNPVYDNYNGLNQKETYDGKAITDYHGYGAVDFYAVDEHLGDLALFRKLVDEAHKLGLKVIQDEVANHTGPYHPWVKDSPTPTWYNGTEAKHLANTWQTWTLQDRHSPPGMQKATLEGWFIDILPDLNQDDPECARYLIQNTLWWFGVSGMDAVRQDTLPYVPRSFWHDWMAAIKGEYPKAAVVGELFDGDPALVSFFQGGRRQFDGIDTGVDTLFDFPLYYQLRSAFIERRPLRNVPMMIARDHLYPDPSVLVTFLGLHDVSRFMNEPGAGLAGLKLAFTVLMTSRGTPLVYYGDEIGMKGGNDPDNRRDFPGGWAGDPRNAFDPGGRTPEEQSLWSYIRLLTSIRASQPPLRHGNQVNLLADDDLWVYVREIGGSAVIVVINNSDLPAEVKCPVPYPDGTFPDLLGGEPAKIGEGKLTVHLNQRSAAIFIH